MKYPTIFDELFEADEADRFAITMRMTMDEKFFAGYELFKREVERMRVVLRKQFPSMNDLDVERTIGNRIDMMQDAKVSAP